MFGICITLNSLVLYRHDLNQNAMAKNEFQLNTLKQKLIRDLGKTPGLENPLNNLKNKTDTHNSAQDLNSEYQSLFINSYVNKDYQNAVYYGEKLLPYFPRNIEFLRGLAYSYFELKNYEKSMECYQKVLELSPDNDADKRNYYEVKRYIENDKLNNLINNVRVTKKAPPELYTLIKINLHSDIKEETEGILDVIWNVPCGQMMLQTILDKKIPINIIESDTNAATHAKFVNGNLTALKVDIPIKYIDMVNNTNLSAHDRIYAFHAFMHEFGHAYAHLKDPTSTNSLEEEIGVDMIGYNIAYKVITGHYLTKEQTQTYSLSSLASALTDKHKDLPVYSGFTVRMQKYGMPMPYPEMYSNIPAMYKKLVSAGLTKQVASLENIIQ